MPTVTVHVTDEEKELLARIAKIEGRSVSALEDKYDAQLGDVAFNEYLKDPQSRPLVESLEEYGLRESD